MNLVVVDIGNTSTTFALARGRRLGRAGRLPTRRASEPGTVAGVLRRLVGGTTPDGAVLCSVVPRATARWRRELARLAPVIEVTHRTRLGVEVRYPHPRTIGPDRLVNACAAYRQFGAPVVVADFGTALTFDIVDRTGAYVGGVIAPGLPLMTDYLAERTALLPRIRLPGAVTAIGRSTRGAMRIGAQIGYRGMVREITAHIMRGLGERRVALCATGGYAAWALKDAGMDFVIDADLTLKGLIYIHELNRGRDGGHGSRKRTAMRGGTAGSAHAEQR